MRARYESTSPRDVDAARRLAPPADRRSTARAPRRTPSPARGCGRRGSGADRRAKARNPRQSDERDQPCRVSHRRDCQSIDTARDRVSGILAELRALIILRTTHPARFIGRALTAVAVAAAFWSRSRRDRRPRAPRASAASQISTASGRRSTPRTTTSCRTRRKPRSRSGRVPSCRCRPRRCSRSAPSARCPPASALSKATRFRICRKRRRSRREPGELARSRSGDQVLPARRAARQLHAVPVSDSAQRQGGVLRL